MRALEKWLGVSAVLLALCPAAALAQGANTFDGNYVGVSAKNLGTMGTGSTSRCETFNAPARLTIAGGHAQAPWNGGILDGQVSPDGALRMKGTIGAGVFEGRITNGTIAGRYQGTCNYDLSWRKQ
jgi:hypothetical protein